ncbi:fasciclin-like arabinogalactan protein 7 [Cucurbita pepo subsp. pepo]|uniref:fasciclin-like arabinogalactan protein 7 n=1 Tax=Cucurbita pepo subsp. pepo TaxID=3664 RepID=UPI000C9D45B1|nr:fasciclin-like arabinogalactan protein 7 [Cucurbita pepo subsp. pepo]
MLLFSSSPSSLSPSQPSPRTKQRNKMKLCIILLFGIWLMMLMPSSPACAQTAAKPPSFSPTPAPEPAPAPAADHVNLADLLTVAGPFHKFLGYLESTKVIDTFQKQANDSEEGITIFVPKDGAFSSLNKPSLSNLTNNQLKSLLLFHALPHYYTLADFNGLSQKGPITTFAGQHYTLNFTDASGTVHISSGWTNTKVSSSVLSTDPIAVYQVDHVLLPEAIFGTDFPPTPAPVPSPDVAPAADSPSAETEDGVSPSSTESPSSSFRIAGMVVWSQLVLAISAGLLLF